MLLALLAGGCHGPGDGGAGEDPPTVVLVTIDTLRADRLGCYGRPDAGTPVMDGLAAGGARFLSAQTTCPMTAPAHSSILTGRSLPAHGVLSNGSFALPTTVPTLAESFRGAGYGTGAFVSAGVLAARYGLDRGFERYDDQVGTPDARHTSPEAFERAGTDTVAEALSWLGDQGDRPAFLWVHLWEPHDPYRPPAAFASRFPEDPYQGEVAAADAALGELLDGIDAVGRSGHLLVVVVADHGESLGEHGEATHGTFLYRSVLQVPLLVYGPSYGIGPAVPEVEVSVADLPPTLLELSDVAPLEGIDGLSLAPLLRGEAALEDREGVFADSHRSRLEFGWSGLRALVRGRYKLIDAPRPELYDLREDPGEARDLATERPEELASLRLRAAALAEEAAALAPGPQAGQVVSEEEAEMLRALGYTAWGEAGDEGPTVDPEGIDPKDRSDFLSQFDRGLELVRQGRFPAAIQLFRMLDSVEPGNQAVLFELGQAFLAARRLNDALTTYQRLVEAHPGNYYGWLRVGQLLDGKRDWAGAEASYRKAIEANPLLVLPRKALAGLLEEQERRAEALEVLEEALALSPRDPAILADLERLRSEEAR